MSERRSIVPVSPSLLPRAEAVIARALRGTHYLDAALDALREAVRAPGVDARAIAIVSGDFMAGVAVYGIFGGTIGAGRLHFAVVQSEARRDGAGSALVGEAVERLRDEHARFVLAELPDDPRELPAAREFLEAQGFAEESRMADFLREGIALSFMRRELA